MSKSTKLSLFIFSICIVGLVWLVWNLSTESKNTIEVEVCMLRKITGIPCPSCGTTRSTMSIFKGNLVDAFNYNPFGFLVSIGLIVVPTWISFDFVSRKKTFYISYLRAEDFMRNKYVFIPLIMLVVINWIWNIYKYLL